MTFIVIYCTAQSVLFFSKWNIYYCSISFNSIWSVSRQLYDWNIEINRFWIISSLSHSSIAVKSVHGGGGRVFFTRLQLFQLINVTNTLLFVIWLSVVQWNINFRRFGNARDAFAFNLLVSGVLKWFWMLHELTDLDFFLHCQWSLQLVTELFFDFCNFPSLWKVHKFIKCLQFIIDSQFNWKLSLFFSSLTFSKEKWVLINFS